MEPVKVAVVGVGYLGQFHAEKYSRIEGVELAGVVDIDASRAAEIAKRFHTRPFSNHSEIFDAVRAASIAVPTPLHHSIARDLLLHGIDVLVEKPLGCSMKEADDLIGLSERRGLILQVGHSERFNGALLALEGKIDNPLLIESNRSGPFLPRAANVDVVIDLMIHDIDIALSWVHSTVRAVHAVGAPVLSPHVDIANARIEFKNGCVANLSASRISPEKVRMTRVFQPGGYFSIDYLAQKAVFSCTGRGREKTEGLQMVPQDMAVQKVDTLEAETRSFIESVRSRKPPRVSGKDGRRALELALRVTQKIRDHAGTHESWQQSTR